MRWVNLTDLHYAKYGSYMLYVTVGPMRIMEWETKLSGELIASGKVSSLGKAKDAAKSEAIEHLAMETVRNERKMGSAVPRTRRAHKKLV